MVRDLSAFSTHMQDLKEVTQDVHYENYRANCLSVGDGNNTVQRNVKRYRLEYLPKLNKLFWNNQVFWNNPVKIRIHKRL